VQDIAGCRAILPDQDAAYRVLERSRHHKSRVLRVDDHVADPKPSGYRAIHAVVERDGAPVEIQLRTLRQLSGQCTWRTSTPSTVSSSRATKVHRRLWTTFGCTVRDAGVIATRFVSAGERLPATRFVSAGERLPATTSAYQPHHWRTAILSAPAASGCCPPASGAADARAALHVEHGSVGEGLSTALVDPRRMAAAAVKSPEILPANDGADIPRGPSEAADTPRGHSEAPRRPRVPRSATE
jgi:hypothetical protein